ncbi:unnamed protein product [Caenorhabditis angaria]|uniref:HIG1 domain-containing protein n=1 Tax=Caenorhabditis angaria TaxID=860376 RepID=A0A9P1IMD9_9PELO|nr:unnamed protein product [Caenorhabditis angaria]
MNKEPHDFRDHAAHMQWTQERDNYKANVPLIPQDMSAGSRNVSNTSSVLQKALNNPLVPIGMATTVGCLVGMMVATLRRSSKDAQLFMRGRCLAQGFTVAALVGGAIMFGIGAPSESALRATPGKIQNKAMTPPPANLNLEHKL